MKKQILFLSLLVVAPAYAYIQEETLSKKTIYTINKLYLDAIRIENDTNMRRLIEYIQEREDGVTIRKMNTILPGEVAILGTRTNAKDTKQKLFIAGKEISFTPRCVLPGHVTTTDRDVTVKISELS